MVKLANWTARFAPKQLIALDPILRFPDFLTEEDAIQILSTGNSIFWETSPPDISIFYYAYIDLASGLVYSDRNISPNFISFHFSGLGDDRLQELKKLYPERVVFDFLYVSMEIG
jgi:hypothetical protein